MSLRDVNELEREKFQQFMMDDVERLDGLISHLLDAGTIEKSSREQSVVEIDLEELIRGCASTVCARYRVEQSTVEFDLAACQIVASRVDAVMIFRNLLDNAVKYAGIPPRVNVSLRRDGDFAIVEISDNGEGIPKPQRRKVFGRFVRLGEELQRKKPGTGLGLYIVRTLVKRLRGTVEVLDRDKRQGTVFQVRLPNAKFGVSRDSGDAKD
jgi:signal transduction histidine kinase